MNYTLEHFQPQHDHLICVDSDGCGMDTMTIKHERAFGPALLDIWNLDDIKDDVGINLTYMKSHVVLIDFKDLKKY